MADFSTSFRLNNGSVVIVTYNTTYPNSTQSTTITPMVFNGAITHFEAVVFQKEKNRITQVLGVCHALTPKEILSGPEYDITKLDSPYISVTPDAYIGTEGTVLVAFPVQVRKTIAGIGCQWPEILLFKVVFNNKPTLGKASVKLLDNILDLRTLTANPKCPMTPFVEVPQTR